MEATPTAAGSGPPYGLTLRLDGVSLAQARARVEGALQAQGFGVLTEIDVQATLRNKLGAEFRPYVILGACNPQLAHRALTEELGVGLLLPCNVALWQDGAAVVVSIADPAAMFSVADQPALRPIADEAGRRLRAALATLAAPAPA